MITSTMSFAEIANELRKNRTSIEYKFVNHLLNNQSKIRKLAIQQSKQHPNQRITLPLQTYTIEDLTYLILPIAPNKKTALNFNYTFGLACIFRYKPNELMLAIFGRHDEMSFFKSHLFDRYQERFLQRANNEQLTKKNVMKQFFIEMSNQTQHGIIVSSEKTQNPKVREKYGENACIGTTPSGLILGNYIDKQNAVFSTYITKDMAKNDEITSDEKTQEIANNYSNKLLQRYQPKQQRKTEENMKVNFDPYQLAFTSSSLEDCINKGKMMNITPEDLNTLIMIYKQIHQNENKQYNTIKRNTIRLTESQLHNIIKESVKKILREIHEDDNNTLINYSNVINLNKNPVKEKKK